MKTLPPLLVWQMESMIHKLAAITANTSTEDLIKLKLQAMELQRKLEAEYERQDDYGLR